MMFLIDQKKTKKATGEPTGILKVNIEVFRLMELRNCILGVNRVWSLFCLLRVCTFYVFFRKTSFFVFICFLCFLFVLCFEFNVTFMDFIKLVQLFFIYVARVL